MKIHNTLSGRKEEFAPLEGKTVRMYVCGITPYDKSHLGHARTLISFDIIRRYLAYRGYDVKFVQNVTDIDDKIIKRARERKMLPLALSEKYMAESETEFLALGIMKPDFSPKVSGFIPQIISLIEKIEARGFAYSTKTGVYFDVAKFKSYGKLSGQKQDGVMAGARVEVDEAKKNPQDFALWKLDDEPGATFGSPWGRGRPGWHIECSAMAMAILGSTIDIHGGALDLVFPHHENEIAQSEAATGEPFARFFMHTGFLTVKGEKMSKSLGNFITIEDGLKKFEAVHMRMLFAMAHYKSPMDFTEESVKAAGNSLASLHSAVLAARTYAPQKGAGKKRLELAAREAKENFILAMDDDFDTPAAMAELFHFAKSINGACSEGSESAEEVKAAGKIMEELLAIFNLAPGKSSDGKAADEIDAVCRKFGITVEGALEEKILALINARQEARKAKDFARSDQIRDALAGIGIVVEDRRDGSAGWHFSA
ncbi:MAG: cysteine--tRNA ligase [Candidatus Micrarchaeota archaeon]|nr:cysteine--tRNA ligase [Candidatus Micrarchaeota archaeon]